MVGVVFLVLALGCLGSFGWAGAGEPSPVVGFPNFFHDNLEAASQTGYLLGGWAKGAWVKDKAMTQHLRSGSTYRLYTLTGELGQATGSQTTPFGDAEEPCHDTLAVSLSPFPPVREHVVAVGGPWNAQPRKPKLLSTNQPAYRQAVADILAQKGFAAPKINIAQVMRVDLDGNGTEEVLVSAANYEFFESGGLSPQVRAGDYSLVLLRQVDQGKVTTKVIAGEFFPQAKKHHAPSEVKVGAILDLNGDGIMEVILCGRYYEGNWVEAHQIKGTQITKLFSSGCGL